MISADDLLKFQEEHNIDITETAGQWQWRGDNDEGGGKFCSPRNALLSAYGAHRGARSKRTLLISDSDDNVIASAVSYSDDPVDITTYELENKGRIGGGSGGPPQVEFMADRTGSTDLGKASKHVQEVLGPDWPAAFGWDCTRVCVQANAILASSAAEAGATTRELAQVLEERKAGAVDIMASIRAAAKRSGGR